MYNFEFMIRNFETEVWQGEPAKVLVFKMRSHFRIYVTEMMSYKS